MTNTSARRPGPRPGHGMQLPAIERTRKSREKRASAGAVRVDLTLDSGAASALEIIMQHWQSQTKRDAIQRAILAAAQTIEGK